MQRERRGNICHVDGLNVEKKKRNVEMNIVTKELKKKVTFPFWHCKTDVTAN
jgi:hypothetical protein